MDCVDENREVITFDVGRDGKLTVEIVSTLAWHGTSNDVNLNLFLLPRRGIISFEPKRWLIDRDQLMVPIEPSWNIPPIMDDSD